MQVRSLIGRLRSHNLTNRTVWPKKIGKELPPLKVPWETGLISQSDEPTPQFQESSPGFVRDLG